jgi:hypothetical protein
MALQTVIGVFDNKNPIIKEEDIYYTLIREYSYGIGFEVNIGIPYQNTKLEQDKEYFIYFVDSNSQIKLYLHSIYYETIGKDKLVIYKFVNRIFSKMLKNKLPNNFTYLEVDFKTYVKERNNQLAYFAFGLRKKGLMLVNKNGKTSSIHIQKKLHEKPKDIEAFIVKPLLGFELKAPNYYTKQGGKIIRTKNGKSDPIYLPFATKEDINGLDNYLIPAYELMGVISMYELGDVVKINDKPYIIIEKEAFFYLGERQVYIVCAKKV